MLKLKYIGSDTLYDVSFSKISPHVVQILGNIPFNENGFTLSRINKNDNWEYPEYKTLYRTIEGGIQLSDDGSVYIEPEEPTTPEPTTPEPEIYAQTLEELREAKVIEMNMTQQATIQSGIDVVLTDGTTEHFTLTEKDQISLMGLQTRVAMGEESIGWHTSDETEHCRYYANADMMRITTAAMEYVTFHVTYFRDLRIYIRSLETKEEVEAVTYGMEIPEEYRSQPLKDMLTSAS